MVVKLTASALEPGGTSEVRDGYFYCSHTYKIDAPPEKVLGALQGDWDQWWSMGRRLNVRVDDRGVTHWKFIPLKTSGMMVWFNIDMDPPRVDNGPSGSPEKIVLELKLDGACVGPARYEVFATPDGGSFLRGSWNGVKPRGWRRFATGMFGSMHLLVESWAVRNMRSMLA